MRMSPQEWRQNTDDNARLLEEEIKGLEKNHRDGERYNYKEFFAHAKEVVAMFKDLKPLTQEDRARLWENYRTLCDGAAKQRQDWFDSAKKNAGKIEKELDSLRSSHGLGFLAESNPFAPDINFAEFWNQAREISEIFKNLKPVLKEDREKLWNLFNETRDKVRAIQNSKREKQKRNSEGRKEEVLYLIKQADMCVYGCENPDDLTKAKEFLDEAVAKMKPGWDEHGVATYLIASALGDDGRLLKEDRQECWDRFNEVKEKIQYKRQDLWQKNYDYVEGEIGKAYNLVENDRLKETFAQLRAASQALKDAYLSRDKREILREYLNSVWDKAKSLANQKQQEWEAKKQDWMNRMQDKTSRLQGVVEKQEDFVSRMESQISDLEDRIRGSSNDRYIEQAEGWIEEKRQKVRDAEQGIEEIRGKIRSIQDSLNE